MSHSRPLISGPLRSELDLIEFLRPYKRVRTDAVCQKNVDASQVTVWISKNGEWLRGKPRNTKESGSWCQSYLTAMLGLSPAQYEVAKKEMFSPQDGLNGVYVHESQKKFALVYRPAQRWSNRTKAAIAGGAVLAGSLGLAGTRYAMRSRPNNQAAAQPGQTTDPFVEIHDELSRIEAELQAKLDDEDSILSLQGLDGDRVYLDAFEDTIQRAVKVSPKSQAEIQSELNFGRALHERVLELMARIETLSRLGMPKTNILQFLNGKYAFIINSTQWKNVKPQIRVVLKYIEAHRKEQLKLQIANQFDALIQNANEKYDEGLINEYLTQAQTDINELVNVARSDPLELKQALNELIDFYTGLKRAEIVRMLLAEKIKLDPSDETTANELRQLADANEQIFSQSTRSTYIEERRKREPNTLQKTLDELYRNIQTAIQKSNSSTLPVGNIQGYGDYVRVLREFQSLGLASKELSSPYEKLLKIASSLQSLAISENELRSLMRRNTYESIRTSDPWKQSKDTIIKFANDLIDTGCKTKVIDDDDCQFYHKVAAMALYDEIVKKSSEPSQFHNFNKVLSRMKDSVGKCAAADGNCPYFAALEQVRKHYSADSNKNQAKLEAIDMALESARKLNDGDSDPDE